MSDVQSLARVDVRVLYGETLSFPELEATHLLLAEYLLQRVLCEIGEVQRKVEVARWVCGEVSDVPLPLYLGFLLDLGGYLAGVD